MDEMEGDEGVNEGPWKSTMRGPGVVVVVVVPKTCRC